MSKDQMFAKVILASTALDVSYNVPTLFTMHWRYPRIFHGEVMTHRDFSRNARSSRAVPVMTMIREVWNKPFVPWHWGSNQKGMQAGAPLTGWKLWLGKKTWITASKLACIAAYALYKLGFHKQIGNRLLEPFSFIDTLISSTQMANFFHLRNHKDAEPHFQDLARMVLEAVETTSIQMLEPGVWHLPYVNASDVEAAEAYLEPYPETTHATMDVLKMLSVARCARISYKPFDGDASIEKEIERYHLLVGSQPLHASPAEHQATPDTLGDYERNFIDENGNAKLLEGGLNWDHPELAGNLGPGWIQYRKTLKGEYVKEAA